MKNVSIVSLLPVFIAFSCVSNTSLVESRLETERSTATGLSKGNILEIDTFALDIISPSSGVQFYKDGIIFLASSKNENDMLREHISFGILKTYYAGIYEGTLFKYTDFSPTVLFDYPSEATTFSSDFKTMYFTRLSATDVREKIYKATFTGGQDYQTGWNISESPLSFCLENYVYTHPALSNDDKILIFASDKRGSTGGLDLFITQNKSNDWSEPENMGYNINSKNNELFPFIDSHKNLFFSSDRVGGFGGFDIYFCRYNGKNWEKPELLTSRINTAGDDMAFVIDRRDNKTAFFTVRTKNGKTDNQLYRITINDIIAENRTKDITSLLVGMTAPESSQLTASAGAIKDTVVIPSQVQEPISKPSGSETVPAGNKVTTVIAAEPKTVEKVTADAKAVPTVATPATTTTKEKGDVIYRIQILATSNSKGSYSMKISGKDYMTWEYLYKGAYRTTVGEFKTLAEASKFQNECRKSGFKEAFVVVFVDNIRSTDPAFFK